MSLTALLVGAIAFLLGSIPFGYLLVRLRTGGDVRRQGSGNIGATNVLRTAGRGLGALTLVLDAAKGAAAMVLALHVGGGPGRLAAAALLLVMLGHVFTPWLRFQGGKGVATALGAFLVLAPLALAAAAVVFFIVVTLSRYVSLASICASLALPLFMLAIYRAAMPPVVDAAAVAAAALVIARHHANLGRLRAGTESRLGGRAATHPREVR